MIVRGAESSFHTGLEVDIFHFGRVENGIGVGPNETKVIATEGFEFGFSSGKKHWSFGFLSSMVIVPRTGVVVDGEKSITFVSNGPGEHA